jgi:acyl carrier protein
VESIINTYISGELVSRPELLPLRNDTVLLETGLLDSLAVLKLVLFLEEQFGVVVDPADLIAEHFQTVDAICAYLRKQQLVQGVQ